MAAIVIPGNMILGSILSIDHSTAGIGEKDLIKMQQSKVDYTDLETYVIVPAGKTLSIDFELPEKAFVEKIRVYYTPDSFASFSGSQMIQPIACYINKVADDSPIVLRDPKDLDDTFRDPTNTTVKLVDNLNLDTNTNDFLVGDWNNYEFQTSHLWNSLMVDFGLIRPINQFRLYSPYRLSLGNHGGNNRYVTAFGYWYELADKHGEVMISLDGVNFRYVTDLLVPYPGWSYVNGFTGTDSDINASKTYDNRRSIGFFNQNDGLRPILARYIKFNQNGARRWTSSPFDHNDAYGVVEADFYQFFSESRIVEAIYFRDDELMNVAHRFAGYQIPSPVSNPMLRYQDLYIHDITDKIRVNFTAHPSYATWVGGIVASGAYSSLNFGQGADNEINLLDAPVGQPSTAQPVVINNDSDILMTDVEITPGFDTTSDLQDVIEISEDEQSWYPIFEKIGYGLCLNDSGSACGVGNPDKQYVIKCQQGFMDECSSYTPLHVNTYEVALESAKFQGNPQGAPNFYELLSWDGSNSTSWVSTLLGPDPANHAWIYDFGAQRFMSHIMVRVSTDNHIVEVSTNGTSWSFPVANTIIAGSDQYYKIDGTYRFVRIYADPSAGGVNTRVTEVKIFLTDYVYREKTWILDNGVQQAGVINDLWYDIGYIPYGEDGDVELYVLRPNGADYDLIYSSGTINVTELGIYRHIVDRQVIVQPGDLIAMYTTGCGPQLIVGGGDSSWGDGNITGTVLQSAYGGVGHKLALNAKVGILLNIGNINPNTSKVVFVRSNIPSSLSQAYERDIDLIIATRTNLP